MSRILIEIPRSQANQIDIRFKDQGPLIIRRIGERVARIPEIRKFLSTHIEALVHTLGGNYDELPPEIDQIRQFIIHNGYTDDEVRHEVKQTLKQALS